MLLVIKVYVLILAIHYSNLRVLIRILFVLVFSMELAVFGLMAEHKVSNCIIA